MTAFIIICTIFNLAGCVIQTLCIRRWRSLQKRVIDDLVDSRAIMNEAEALFARSRESHHDSMSRSDSDSGSLRSGRS